MEKLVIKGGTPLRGSVSILGAKNSAIAILPATLLCKGICTLHNVPNIIDVRLSCQILEQLGSKITWIDNNTLIINNTNISKTHAPLDLTSKFRASYYLIGAMLGRSREIEVGLPGGCNLGARPIDQHIKGFEALGATSNLSQGKIYVKADKLVGTSIYMDVVSVGATINVLLSSVFAEGTTIIDNAAKEPHVVDVANFLNSMGADVRGAGTDVIKIRGGKPLVGRSYAIIPDQIEAGTYMVAAAAAGGKVRVCNVIPKHLESITAKLRDAGVTVVENDDSVEVSRKGKLFAVRLKTQPYPGFPTDMQPQLTALMTVASGESQIREGVYDKRFGYVSELAYMGAKINVDDDLCVVKGVEKLNGAKVRSLDLRAGAAMIIAGLMADGVTEVEDKGFIERGYEDLINKFRSIGADITREEV